MTSASVSVLETRQRWHARGGVTQQATKWWPIEPSEEATNDVVDRLNAKLKEKDVCPHDDSHCLLLSLMLSFLLSPAHGLG